ncbi:unnamed protein product, partial [Rotaria magnacalcarata]
MAIALYPIAKIKLIHIRLIVFFDSKIAVTTSKSSSRIKTIEAASTATSVPLPTAMPTSARASAG